MLRELRRNVAHSAETAANARKLYRFAFVCFVLVAATQLVQLCIVLSR